MLYGTGVSDGKIVVCAEVVSGVYLLACLFSLLFSLRVRRLHVVVVRCGQSPVSLYITKVV